MVRWFTERAARLGISLGMRTGCLAARILPSPWLYRFSDMLAGFAFYFARGFRTRSVKNVSLALGDTLNEAEVRETARASLRHFLRDFVDIWVGLANPPEQFRSAVPVNGRGNLDAALAKGRGAIVLSAHLGNFLLLGVRLAMEGYAVHVLVNQPRNGQFARLINDYRVRTWHNTIYARPKPDAVRELSQALRRNEVVVIIADEHRKGAGIHVPFFGHTVLARRGPVTVALRTGAAVVPAYLARGKDGKLKLTIEPELGLVRSGHVGSAIQENVVAITQWLEKTVRAYPNQWNWMNIHWQGGSQTPPSETATKISKIAEGYEG